MHIRSDTIDRLYRDVFAGCRRSAPSLLLLAVFIPGFSAVAAEPRGSAHDEFLRSHVSKEGEWKELESVLPAYPDDQNLVPVPLPPADTVKAYLDRKSLSRAADRVARYTLVLESSSGTRSVFFEGIRCETREYKTYAIGADGAFQPVKGSAWKRIPYFERNAFRFTLYKHHVCDDGASSARTPPELIESLKHDR